MSGTKRNLLVGMGDLNRGRLNQPIKNLILAAVLLSAWMASPAVAQFSGGSGSKTNPYLIATPGDLKTIGDNSIYWADHFKLTADLNLTGVAMTPIGNRTTKFTGTFNGNGQTIANLTINLPMTDQVGLFGVMENAVDPNTIYNLGLINPNITGDWDVGVLAGQMSNGTLSGCYANGGNVNGDQFVGGLVGRKLFGTISNCYTTVTVTGTSWYVGGLVGINVGTISGCYATGTVTGTGFNIGGLVGRNFTTGSISNCYATGQVNGSNDVGGLVGRNSGTISNCYAIGLVKNGISSSKVGGLVGFNGSGFTINGGNFVISSYWAIDSSGQATSAGGIGKLLVEMKQVSTFFAWGCDPVWTIDEGIDAPRLLRENAPGILITTKPSYSGGTGDPATPYLISDANDLWDLSQATCDWDKNFRLISDPIWLESFSHPSELLVSPLAVLLTATAMSLPT